MYNQKGKETGKIALPESIFNVKWNGDLVHQVVTSMLSSRRSGTAHTKGRGEVRGGGKKPYRQKGTGRARHGSRRSPIWKGGGTTFGPSSEKNYLRKVNRSMKEKALSAVLSKKFEDGEVYFLDALNFTEPKARLGKEVLTSLSKVKGLESVAKKKTNAILFALESKNASAKRSLQNFGNIAVEEARNLNPVDLLQYRFVIIVNPEATFETIPVSSKISSKESSPKK